MIRKIKHSSVQVIELRWIPFPDSGLGSEGHFAKINFSINIIEIYSNMAKAFR